MSSWPRLVLLALLASALASCIKKPLPSGQIGVLEVSLVTADEAASERTIDFAGADTPLEESRFFALADVELAEDDRGLPAVAFDIARIDRDRFRDWTRSSVGRQLVFLVDGEIVTMATIQDELPGRGLIQGGPDGFTRERCRAIVASIRSGG